jgi:redox-sensitive bicupin YhaK (pirin superfamily)
MSIAIYPPNAQGSGQFDGGKITEQKPIGFPGEGSAVKRIGPLFYWAWFHTDEEGFIPPHPHQGFEIITYVMKGTAEHEDSLGTFSRITDGGAQVMQTGSGAYHSERFIGPDMDGFQIWFEPNLREAVRRDPTYNEYKQGDFTVEESDGYTSKPIIGSGAPVSLVSDVSMRDVTLKAGGVYERPIREGNSLAVVVVEGSGTCKSDLSPEASSFKARDFVVISPDAIGLQTVSFESSGESVRLIMIEVPVQVDYPLYRK